MARLDQDTGKIVTFAPERDSHYPGWWRTDCGCCGGIQWGGESPRDCWECKGAGVRWLHKATGTVAEYPGGPLLGRLSADEIREVFAPVTPEDADG